MLICACFICINPAAIRYVLVIYATDDLKDCDVGADIHLGSHRLYSHMC